MNCTRRSPRGTTRAGALLAALAAVLVVSFAPASAQVVHHTGPQPSSWHHWHGTGATRGGVTAARASASSLRHAAVGAVKHVQARPRTQACDCELPAGLHANHLGGMVSTQQERGGRLASRVNPPTPALTVVHVRGRCNSGAVDTALPAWWPTLPRVIVSSDATDEDSVATLRRAFEVVETDVALVVFDDMLVAPSVDPSRLVSAVLQSGATVVGGVVSGPASEISMACYTLQMSNYSLLHTFGGTSASTSTHSGSGCVRCDMTSLTAAVHLPRLRMNALGLDGDPAAAMLAVFLSAHRARATGAPSRAVVVSCPAVLHVEMKSCRTVHDTTRSGCSATHTGAWDPHSLERVLPRYKLSHAQLPMFPELKTCKFGSTQGTNNEVNGRCDYDEAWSELLLLREELKRLGAAHAVATGTLLGLVKFGRLCPWDYDIDVNVWLSSWEEMKPLAMPAFRTSMEARGLSWKCVRTSADATVLQAGGAADLDVYITVLNEESKFHENQHTFCGKSLTPYYPERVYKAQPTNASRAQGWSLSWRNVAEGGKPGHGGFVAPTADLFANGVWLPVRRYNYPVLAEKYGPTTFLLHVTRAMGASVEKMAAGRYGKTALTRASRLCPPDEWGTGCLDGWVWFQDWGDTSFVWRPSAGGRSSTSLEQA